MPLPLDYAIILMTLAIKADFLLVEMRGVDLRCGAGRVAALRRPRRLIHSRSRSTPQNNQNKQPTLTGGLPVLAEDRNTNKNRIIVKFR